MKQAPVRPQVVLLAFVLSVAINISFYKWVEANSLLSFRVVSTIRTINYRVNDLFHLSYFLVQDRFDEIVADSSLTSLTFYIMSTWAYEYDNRFWDVASPPVQSFISRRGDCDDFARLMTYILHQKGFVDVYYVPFVLDDSGHAVTVYYDHDERQITLLDVNGYNISFPLANFDLQKHVPMLVKSLFENAVHVDIRTWDTRKSIASITVREISTDEIPI